MAKKPAAAPAAKKTAKKAAKKTARKEARAPPAPPPGRPRSRASIPTKMATMDLSKMKMMTPEQAMDLYKANAKMALDIINAAIENTTKLRRLQFEGEEESRAMGRKAARAVARGGHRRTR